MNIRKQTCAILLVFLITAALCSSTVSASAFEHTAGGGLKTDFAIPREAVTLSGEDAASLNERMGLYEAPEVSLIRNRAESYYYYSQLEALEMQIYDVIVTVASDPTDVNNIGLVMTTEDPASRDFNLSFSRAFHAVILDHPELFWLYILDEIQIMYSAERESSNGIYFVYVLLNEAYENFEAEMTAFNTAVDEFLAAIDTETSVYELVRQIHDRLISQVTYDTPVADQNISSDLAHTAYGALVCDSSGSSQYAVCDGYSAAMEYLLQQCGVNATVVNGDAGPDALSAGGHAWNLVEIDGCWYEMDATWDDQDDLESSLPPDDTMYEYYLSALRDDSYMEKISHYLFLISTDTMAHFEPGESYNYNFADGAWVRMIGSSIHRRWGSDTLSMSDFDAARKGLIDTAPIAERDY